MRSVPRERTAGLREVAPDPPGWLTALRFDVDLPPVTEVFTDLLGGRDIEVRVSAAAQAWIGAGLPPPNLVVVNPATLHAHLVWLLAVWVRADGARGWREVRYASAVDAAMTAALGADPAYSGRFGHNPLCGAWQVRELRARPYALSELAAHLDLAAAPSRTFGANAAGRNAEVFERLRIWAGRAVGAFRAGRREDWADAVAARAAAIAAEVRAAWGPRPERYSDAEVRATARSVARWVWERAGTGLRSADGAVRRAAEALRARARRRAAGAAERAEYEAAARRRAAAVADALGRGLSIRAAAAEIGCSPSEVHRLARRSAAPRSACVLPSEFGASDGGDEGRKEARGGTCLPAGRPEGEAERSRMRRLRFCAAITAATASILTGFGFARPSVAGPPDAGPSDAERLASARRFAAETVGDGTPDAYLRGDSIWDRIAESAIAALALADGADPLRDPARMRARLHARIGAGSPVYALWSPLARHPDPYVRSVAKESLDRPEGELASVHAAARKFLRRPETA